MKALLSIKFFKYQKLVFETTKEIYQLECGDIKLDEEKLRQKVINLTTGLILNWKGDISYHCEILYTRQTCEWTV